MSSLHLLPNRTGAAAENMALDFLLLQRYPDATAPRFRHYKWRRPAFTFGFSQKIEFVRTNLPRGEQFDLCRRPTGGGIVDHRNDWTYTLVLPRGHALYDERAAQSYRVVHECLAKALVELKQPAAVKTECEACADGPGICFQRAELYDVVNTATGLKIAGAAQKRNKHGLLFQGSIGRTDFPRGNHAQLVESITTRLWPLGDDVRFVPGHGPMSSFGQERKTNPFVADHNLAQ